MFPSVPLSSEIGSHVSRLAATHHVVEGDLELLIFLLPPPECWDYRQAPPGLVFDVGLEVKPRPLCVRGKDAMG